MPPPAPRPRVVTAAFWCWAVASVMLMVGGLIVASVNLPVPLRVTGVLTALAGAALAFVAARVRTGGDVRFRRAAVALSLATIALVALMSVFGVVQLLTVLAVFPLLAAAVLITRPQAKQEERQ